MSTKPRDDHVIFHAGTKGDLPYVLECQHCGQIQEVAMPISIDWLAAIGKAFGRTHRTCKKKTENTEENREN